MSNTFRPELGFETLPALRRDLLRSVRARKEARDCLVKRTELRGELAGLRKFGSEAQCAAVAKEIRCLEERGRALHERAERILRKIRRDVTTLGALQDLQIAVVAEMRRLPSFVVGLPYGQFWDEYYAIRAASKAAWDVPSTEFQAAMSLFWDSPQGRSLDKVRLKIRDKKRLKDGHWKKATIKQAKREREAARRARMTDDEREALKAARRAKYQEAKSKKALYRSMLDDSDLVQGVA